MKYVKNVTRLCSLFDIRSWYDGESVELEKWMNFGFFNTFFISRNGMVTVYYEKDELDKFDKVLDEKLTDNFFDEICNNFFCNNNKLINLKGCPEEVDGDFDCSNNNLLYLNDGPSSVGGEYECYNNSTKFTEEYVRGVCEVILGVSI